MEALFIGSTTKDIIMLVNDPPASDVRISSDRMVEACGGIASASESAFRKLGGSTGLITAVGEDDPVTEFIVNDLTQRDTEYLDIVKVEGTKSPFSSILVEKSGKRCIANYGGSVRKMGIDAIDKDAVKSARYIHLGGLGDRLFIDLAEYIKSNTSAVLSVDGGNVPAEVTDAILSKVDIYIPDDKTVMKEYGFTPEEACRYFADRGVKYSCVTMGDKGSLCLYDGRFFFEEAIEATVVDTTGAGDNFHGAFLFCLSRGYDMQTTLRFCNTYSALCCRALGGLVGEPDFDETIKRAEEAYGIKMML